MLGLLCSLEILKILYLNFISNFEKYETFTYSLINFVKACAQWKKPRCFDWFLKVNVRYEQLGKYLIEFIVIYPLSLFFWYILLKSMMIGDIFLIVQLYDSVEHNLQEWIQLGEY